MCPNLFQINANVQLVKVSTNTEFGYRSYVWTINTSTHIKNTKLRLARRICFSNAVRFTNLLSCGFTGKTKTQRQKNAISNQKILNILYYICFWTNYVI
jgi:hypothetical protein